MIAISEKATQIRKLTVESLEKQATSEIDDSVINTCTSIQKSFFTFGMPWKTAQMLTTTSSGGQAGLRSKAKTSSLIA